MRSPDVILSGRGSCRRGFTVRTVHATTIGAVGRGRPTRGRCVSCTGGVAGRVRIWVGALRGPASGLSRAVVAIRVRHVAGLWTTYTWDQGFTIPGGQRSVQCGGCGRTRPGGLLGVDVVVVDAAPVAWILDLPGGWQRVVGVAIARVTVGTTSHCCSFNDRRVRGMDERHSREHRLRRQGVHERRRRRRGQRGVAGVCALGGGSGLGGRLFGGGWGARDCEVKNSSSSSPPRETASSASSMSTVRGTMPSSSSWPQSSRSSSMVVAG
jgi:hypothetical protein